MTTLISKQRLLLAGIYVIGVAGILASGGGGGGGPVLSPTPTVTASFTVSPTSGAVPLDVMFDGSASSASQGTIIAYEWDFGDGVTLSTAGPTTSHRYTVPDSYTVRLTARLNTVITGTTTRMVTATPAQQAIWLGGYFSNLFPDSALRGDFTRAGNVISGSYDDGEGRRGTMTVTLTSGDATVQFDETTPGCSGSFSGSGIADTAAFAGVTSLLFDFTGSNCDGTHSDGAVILIEQLTEVLSWGHFGLGEVRVEGDDVFFTDLSEFPLKKVDTTTGVVTPLAYAMRGITSLTLAGSDLLWTDLTEDLGDTGCAGANAKRALVRAAPDGTNPRRIAEGDFCSLSVQEAAVSDGSYAYWIRTNALGPFLQRVPLAGGTPERIAELAVNATVVFATDATHIYWAESLGSGATNAIKRCPLAGCGMAAPTVITSATTYAFQGNIVLNADQIYIGLRRDGSMAPAIARVPKAGGTLTDIVTGASGNNLLTDGSLLVWSETDGSSISSIWTAPIAGGVAVQLAASIDRLRGLALGTTDVYWIEGTSGTNQNDGRVRRVPKAGGPIVTVKSDAVWPEHLQVDGAGAAIYADGGIDANRPQGIRRVTLAGATTTLAKGIPASQPLAVDANFVYLPAGFSIVKVPRNGLTVAQTVSPAGFFVLRVEVDDTNVYWLEGDPSGSVFRAPVAGADAATLIGAANGATSQMRISRDFIFVNKLPDTIESFFKTGGSSGSIAEFLEFPDDFVVSEGDAFIVESDAREISSIEFGFGGYRTVASQIPMFTGWWALAQDSAHVYLMSLDGLDRYNKTTGNRAPNLYGPVLHDEFEGPGSLAVDATHVYWTETALGAIKRAPK